MDHYKLLAVVFGMALAVIAVLWIADKAEDGIRTRNIAAANEHVVLFNAGVVLGERRLIVALRTANKIESDSATMAGLHYLEFLCDSLIWERDRITTDTLTMPVKP